MLHIILGILKITGILLGIILLLILAVILAVLFVPVRYRGELKKTGEETSGRLQVSWLLHLIHVKVGYDLEKKQEIDIRILGIRLAVLQSWLSGWKNRRAAGREKKRSRKETGLPLVKSETEIGTSAEVPKDRKEPEADTEPANGIFTENRNTAEQAPAGDTELSNDTFTGDTELTNDIFTGDTESENDSFAGDTESANDTFTEEEEPVGKPPAGEAGQKKRSPGHRITGFFKTLRERVFRILQRIKNILHTLKNLGKKSCALIVRLLQTPERIGTFLDMLEEYEAKEVFGALQGELLYLLTHYRPRKLQGYLRFGTGDPASTGQITGILYLLLPAGAELSLEPDFTETAFETDMTFKGHIRSIHFVRTGWRLFRNKKLKRLLAKVRKRGT